MPHPRLLPALFLVLLSGCMGRCGGDAPPAPPPVAVAPATPAPTPAAPFEEPNHGSDLDRLDDLWDFTDVGATEKQFRALKARFVDQAEDPAIALGLLALDTQLARTRGLQDDFAGAHAILDGVDKAIAAGRADAPRFAQVQIRALLERGRVMNSGDAPKEEAQAQFARAWELASRLDEQGYAVDAAHMLAIVAQGTPEELEWNGKALALAEGSAEPAARKWLGSLYNNLGWGHHDRGDFEQALAYFDKQIVARRAAGTEPALRVALWARARCLRSLGRHQEALDAQFELLAVYPKAADEDGFVHEELGELTLALGRPEKAARSFGRAHELLKDTWLAKAEPERLARIATLAAVAPPPQK